MVMGHQIYRQSDTSSVSVIIPTFNRWNLLPRALESVQNQTLKASEVLVIDDGSDESFGKLIEESFPFVTVFRQENKGVAGARNLGIQKATGEWIALLDSDDEWEKTKLEKQVTFTKVFPQIRAVHTGEKWIRKGNEVTPPSYLDKTSNSLWERSLKHCLICPSSVLIHRSLFETIGLFDERLTVCEDYDFWLRLLLKEEIGLVDEKLVTKHGGHDDQLSTITWGMDRFRIKALQKILTDSQLGPQRKLRILKVLHEKCSILSNGSKKREKWEEAKKYKSLADQYSALLYQRNHQVLR